MASPHLDDLKALSVPGTWRYLRTQPASFWLICFYLFFEYVRPQSIWVVIDVLPWAQVLVLLRAAAFLIDGKKLAFPTVAGATLIFFSAVLLLSSVTAYRQDVSLDNLDMYFEWFFIIFLIINIITTEERFVVFMLLFLLCSFKMAQHGVQTFVGLGGAFATTGAVGSPGFFHNSGEFGIQMCVFIPLSVAFIWALRHRWPLWKQAVLVSFPISGLISIVATSSRGALVGIGFVSIWWWVAVNRRHRIRGLVWVGIVALAVFTIVPQGSRDRFGTAGEDDTSTQRTVRWEQGIQMANERPILGVGHANWTVYHQDHFPSGRGSLLSHNIFVQVGAELGYTGLLAFLMMIWAKFEVNARTRRLARGTPGDDRFLYAMAYGLDGAMVGYLASGFFITVFYYPYFWINLAMTIALHRAMLRKSRQARRDRGRLSWGASDFSQVSAR